MIKTSSMALASLLPTMLFAHNSSLNQLSFNQVYSFTEAFTEGTPALNLRARIEHVDAEGSPRGEAHTLNTKLSFASGNYEGFAALIEFTNTSSYFNSRYNSGLSTTPSILARPIIADPKGTSLNRSFLQYTGIEKTLINFGRQFITLDDQRFVGNNSFRQTPQSFDSISFSNTTFANTELFYSYITEVNNIFSGNDRKIGHNKARSHLANATWQPLAFLTGTAFIYVHNNLTAANASNSSDSYGLNLTGEYLLNDSASLDYSGTYARQDGRHNNPISYKANYYKIGLGAKYALNAEIIDTVRVALAHEVFGSDTNHSNKSFQTVLGSNYEFNGLAGQFITKPDGGLKDSYISTQALFLTDYEATLSLHQFRSKGLPVRFGHEWNIGLSYRWNENFKVGVEFANFDATPNSANYGYVDVNKFWLTATASI
jgi:hypothetical protein